MESVAVLRSIQCIGSRPQFAVQRLRHGQLSSLGLTSGKNLLLSSLKQDRLQTPCAKTSATTLIVNTGETSDLKNGSAAADRSGKNGHRRGTFPNGFEALILEVCDSTEITEVKLKVADFEMHMKRNIEAPQPSVSIALPATTKPVTESNIPATPPAPPPKSSTDKVSPFTNISAEKSTKLSALDASGASGYVIVSSPIVGSFQRCRTLKGKKQPPACKEGDIIKEGQVIGYLDQFGTELPVKSDASGEVLSVLFKDGEAVGYGDPLVAVIPLPR